MASILVAEDEMLVRMLLCDDLADAGHEVIEAADGEIAARLIAGRGSLDLLLTDIRMPGSINGWKLGQIARAAFPEIRVIYATGFTDESCPLLPQERLLSKPFLYRDLRAAILDLGLEG